MSCSSQKTHLSFCGRRIVFPPLVLLSSFVLLCFFLFSFLFFFTTAYALKRGQGSALGPVIRVRTMACAVAGSRITSFAPASSAFCSNSWTIVLSTA